MPGPDWLYLLTAGLLALAGAPLLYWSLFHDRPRGKRRCPRCWYDMAGVPGLTCPECGRMVRSEGKLIKTRRRWGRAVLGAILVANAAITSLVPQARREGTWSVVPTTFVLGLEWLTNDRIPGLVETRERRFAASFDSLWDWQRRELLRRSLRRYVPRSWPEGWPLRAAFASAELPIDDPQRQFFVQVQRPADWSDRERRFGVYDPDTAHAHLISYELPWWDGTWAFRGTQQDRDLPLLVTIFHRGTPEWTTTLRFPVDRTQHLDQIITPIRDPALDRAVRDGLAPRFIILRTSGQRCMVLTRVSDPVCNGITLGINVEVRSHDQVVATARAWMKGGQGHPDGPLDPIVLDGGAALVLPENLDDPAWTIRIRGDGEMALRDFTATKYWAGEFTLPLKDVLK